MPERLVERYSVNDKEKLQERFNLASRVLSLIKKGKSGLKPVHERVLYYRALGDGLKESGEKIGVGKERARQWEKEALSELEKYHPNLYPNMARKWRYSMHRGKNFKKVIEGINMDVVYSRERMLNMVVQTESLDNFERYMVFQRALNVPWRYINGANLDYFKLNKAIVKLMDEFPMLDSETLNNSGLPKNPRKEVKERQKYHRDYYQRYRNRKRSNGASDANASN